MGKQSYLMPSTAQLDHVAGRRISLTAVSIVVVMLVMAGAGHRVLLARIQAALGQVQQLKRPLSTVPLQLGAWQGSDEPIDENTARIAGDDDFINRTYENREAGRSVGVYVGYIGRPRKWMSHRPDVCYRTHGYEQLAQEAGTLKLSDGREVPCFIYEFRSPAMGGPRQLVLAMYIVNGVFLSSLDGIQEMNARRVDFVGERPNHLARVQVNVAAGADRAQDMQTLRDFAAELQADILALLPTSARD